MGKQRISQKGENIVYEFEKMGKKENFINSIHILLQKITRTDKSHINYFQQC